MPHRLRTAFLILLSALASAEVLPAQEAKPANFMQLPAGTTYEIDSRVKAVRVPLTLAGVEPADLEPVPVVLDAVLGAVRNSDLQKAFRPKIVPEGALVIDVPLAPIRQGTYDVKVRVRLKNDRNRNQTLDLRIVQPAAQLQAIDPLIVKRSIGPGGKLDAPKLPLRETSNRTALVNVKIRQTGGIAAAGEAGSPALSFKPVGLLDPDGEAWASYDLTHADGLPLGTVSGKGEVRSPQLAAPVPFTFEIRTRRTVWWIFLLLLLGLACGLLLRTLLPKWIARDQARLLALDVINRIDREIGLRKDSQFVTAVQALRAQLSGVVNNWRVNAEGIEKEVTTTTEALNKELEDLKGRLADAHQKAEQLSRLVEKDWVVPESIRTLLAGAQPYLNTARQNLSQNDAAVAVASVTAGHQVLEGLPGEIRRWAGETSWLLSILESPDLPIPAEMTPGLMASVQKIRGLVTELDDPGPSPSLEILEQDLGAIHRARNGVQALLLQLRDWPGRTVTDVDAVLLRVPLRDRKSVEDLRETAVGLSRTLEAIAAAPEVGAAATRLDTELRLLAESWRKALLAQVAADQADQKAAITALLEERRYRQAVREVVHRLEEDAAAGHRGVAEGLEALAEKSAQGEEVWEGIMGLRLLLPEWSPPRPALDLSPGRIEAARLLIERELGRVTALRTALTWIGLVAVGFLLFRDKVGTVQDFAEVFFWGFGTDITVDAFWTAAKGYKKV